MFLHENYFPLKEAAERISGHDELADELLHYTIDEFLKKDDVETIVQSGGGRWYCVAVMMRQWRSSSSPFYFTYRQPTVNIEEADHVLDEGEDLTEFAEKTREQLQKLPWYDRMLFETYLNDSHTVSSLARATGIPRTSVSLTLNRVRKHVKRSL